MDNYKDDETLRELITSVCRDEIIDDIGDRPAWDALKQQSEDGISNVLSEEFQDKTFRLEERLRMAENETGGSLKNKRVGQFITGLKSVQDRLITGVKSMRDQKLLKDKRAEIITGLKAVQGQKEYNEMSGAASGG